MPRIFSFVLVSSLAAGFAIQGVAQFKTELVNDEGATAPCMGIGPIGGPAAKKCAQLFEQAGFLRSDDVGVAGLTVGKTQTDDGIVTGVDAGSPAASAGLTVGDAITAIESKPVRPTPGVIATRRAFGKKGEELHLKVRRNGSELDVSLVRVPQAVQGAPKSPNFFMTVRPLVDWRGKFVPCVGAGPTAPAVFAYCDSHFAPFGYIKVGELGSTGLKFDLGRTDSALIAEVEAGSPAAKAELRAGDEIVTVDGKPLTVSVGESVAEKLFGKPGDQFHISILRGKTEKTVVLTLAAKAK